MVNKEAKERGVEEKKIICWPSPGCIHKCGLIATVKEGRLIGLKGNKDYQRIEPVISWLSNLYRPGSMHQYPF